MTEEERDIIFGTQRETVEGWNRRYEPDIVTAAGAGHSQYKPKIQLGKVDGEIVRSDLPIFDESTFNMGIDSSGISKSLDMLLKGKDEKGFAQDFANWASGNQLFYDMASKGDTARDYSQVEMGWFNKPTVDKSGAYNVTGVNSKTLQLSSQQGVANFIDAFLTLARESSRDKDTRIFAALGEEELFRIFQLMQRQPQMVASLLGNSSTLGLID